MDKKRRRFLDAAFKYLAGCNLVYQATCGRSASSSRSRKT